MKGRSKKGHFQGFYVPKHPEKYKGDPTKIVFRSSWEHRFCVFLDNNISVLEWASEEIAIPYLKPTDNTGKMHKYYPDFYMKYKTRTGDIVVDIIEIKPSNQTILRERATLSERLTYAVNKSKWEAAELFCKRNGFNFKILTAEQVFK